MMERNHITNYALRPKPQFHIEPPEHYEIVTPLEAKTSIHDKENGQPCVNGTDSHGPQEQHSPILLRKTWIESPSWNGSYASEWFRLFDDTTGSTRSAQHTHPIELSQLKECAFNGQLRNCRFRSICWRLHLGILPLDVRHWSMAITRHRRSFQEIDYVVNLDPRAYNIRDHPLAIGERSRWYRYFNTQEIKRLIAQDVDRTFPDVEYFRSPQVQHSMVNVLYCYVEHSGAEYKQGMHELLAPLFFVLHADQVAFQHACESNAVPAQLKTYLSTLMNERYLEADAFVLFTQIMQYVQPWYANDQIRMEKPRLSRQDSGEIPRLFCSSTDVSRSDQPVASNPGVEFVEEIHTKLLQKYNQDLYYHLKQLDISPALFGLRWIRLLFGHEYPLQDLLYLWDCIFAAEDNLILVRYIYVSMLDYLGSSLLQLGYSDCLSHLMRFPAGADVTYLVQMALHFYQPKQYALPLHAQSPQSTTPTGSRKGRIGITTRTRNISSRSTTAAAFTSVAALATISRASKRSGRLVSRSSTLLDLHLNINNNNNNNNNSNNNTNTDKNGDPTTPSSGNNAEQREVSRSTLSLNRLFMREQSGRSTPFLGLLTGGTPKIGQPKASSRERHQHYQDVVTACWNHVTTLVDELEHETNSQHPYTGGAGGIEIRLDQLERLQLIRSELEKVVRLLSQEEDDVSLQSPMVDGEDTSPMQSRSIQRTNSLSFLNAFQQRPQSAHSTLVDRVHGWTGQAGTSANEPKPATHLVADRPHTAEPRKSSTVLLIRMKLIRKRELPTAPGLKHSVLHTPLQILVDSVG